MPTFRFDPSQDDEENAPKPPKVSKLTSKLLNDLPYVARAGRVSYYVDFNAPEDEYKRGAERKPTRDGANCWSSECRLLPGYHMPCFDVDIDPSKMITTFSYPDENRPAPIEHQYSVKASVEAWMRKLCGNAEVRWVPATTLGHHHVYVDYPVEWSTYSAALHCMVVDGIVETGYYRASERRKGTYVRMPGVLKEAPKEPEALQALQEQLESIIDMEPF